MDIEQLIKDLNYYAFIEKRKLLLDAAETIKRLQEEIENKNYYIDYLSGLIDSYEDSI